MKLLLSRAKKRERFLESRDGSLFFEERRNILLKDNSVLLTVQTFVRKGFHSYIRCLYIARVKGFREHLEFLNFKNVANTFVRMMTFKNLLLKIGSCLE